LFIPCTPKGKWVFESVPVEIITLGQKDDGIDVTSEENLGDQVELWVCLCEIFIVLLIIFLLIKIYSGISCYGYYLCTTNFL